MFVRGVPGNARNVRAADADVGELAVAKTRQFVQALVVALPLLDEAASAAIMVSFFLSSVRRRRSLFRMGK